MENIFTFRISILFITALSFITLLVIIKPKHFIYSKNSHINNLISTSANKRPIAARLINWPYSPYIPNPHKPKPEEDEILAKNSILDTNLRGERHNKSSNLNISTNPNNILASFTNNLYKSGINNTYREYTKHEKPLSEVEQKYLTIISESINNPSPNSLHAASLVYLIQDRLDDAVSTLEDAALLSPNNSKILNDLAAIYLACGEQRQKPKYIFQALSTIDTALSIDPSSLEAKFNKALILEKLSLNPLSQHAWQEYLSLEKLPEWHDEAEKQLSKLNSPPLLAKWPRLREQLNKAATAIIQDQYTIEKIIEEFPYPASTYVLEELIPAWADAQFQNNKDKAHKTLLIAKSIGLGLKQVKGDNFIYDLIKATDNQNDYNAILALRAYHNGVLAYKSYHFDKATTELNKAKEAFVATNNLAGQAVTLFYLALINFDYSVRQKLLDQAKDISHKNFYLDLKGRIMWQYGLIKDNQLEPSNAIVYFKKALNLLSTEQDPESLARINILIAIALNDTGQTEEVYKYHYDSLTELAKTVEPNNYLFFTSLAEQLTNMEELPLARYFYSVASRSVTNSRSKYFLAVLALKNSWLEYKLGNEIIAKSELELAKSRISTEPQQFRYALNDEILWIESNFLIKENPKETIELLNTLISKYKMADKRFFWLLLRAKAKILLKDYIAAEEDLKICITQIEDYWQKINDDEYKTKFFDTHLSAYDEMINLQYFALKQPNVAFDYAERARARTMLNILNKTTPSKQKITSSLETASQPLTLNNIQKELPENITIVEYSLSHEQNTSQMIVWVITKDKTNSIKLDLNDEQIKRLINKYNDLVKVNESTDKLPFISKLLHKKLIEPIKPFLPKEDNSSIVIVPDKSLYFIPFPALLDPTNNRYLIEKYAVCIVPSATIFLRCLQQDKKFFNKPESLFAIGNPKFNRKTFPFLKNLSAAKVEAKEIASLYSTSKLLLENQATKEAFLNNLKNYNVVHFAGHAIINVHNPKTSSLVFASTENGLNSQLYASELYGLELKTTHLVILAACKTGNGRLNNAEGVTSLARPFLAAGVPTVIASLWNANDEATAKLFISFHKNRQAGYDSSTALRLAQLSLINSPDPFLRSPSTWAPFILLGGVNPQGNPYRLQGD